MKPKLYILKNEETDGLIKIGFAGSGEHSHQDDDVVFNRVKNYSAALSHDTTVYETDGIRAFETYFHNFVRTNNKPVRIRFSISGRQKNATEWFELPSQTAQILISAFEASHPNKLEDVSEEDLPIFLSGALSAINWHASRLSPMELADYAAEESQLSELELELGSDEIQKNETATPNPVQQSNYNIEAWTSLKENRRTRLQLEHLSHISGSRTIIAMVTAFIMAILMATKSWVATGVLGILGCLLLAIWPIFQPVASLAYQQHQQSARRAREAELGNDDE